MKQYKNYYIDSGYEVTESGFPVHRKVYEKHYGSIPHKYHVHHINCNKIDNRPENLIALPEIFHGKLHQMMRREKCCFGREEIEYLLSKYEGKENEKKRSKAYYEERRISKAFYRRMIKEVNSLNHFIFKQFERKKKVVPMARVLKPSKKNRGKKLDPSRMRSLVFETLRKAEKNNKRVRQTHNTFEMSIINQVVRKQI